MSTVRSQCATVRLCGSLKAGFSLVEVNMAIMVVGLGMLVLFGLFPAGLREGENALTNTHTALFADAVFSGFRSEAANKTWTQWRGWNSPSVGASGIMGPVEIGELRSMDFPSGSDEWIHYYIEVDGSGSDLCRTVWIWAQSGRHVTDDLEKFKAGSHIYYSGIFYSSGKNE